jgi:hypothetical protein
MKRAYVLLILSALAFFGCSEKKEELSLTSIRPTVIEAKSVLVEFHNREIQKYQEAVAKEKMGILRLLSEHRMREVRQAYGRKQLYVRKIKEHTRALKKIEGLPNETQS